jgi:hypothetical protein
MYRWLGSGLVLLLLVGIQTLDGQSPTSRGKGLGRQHPDGPGRKAIRGEPPVELGALTGEDAVAALSGELGDRVRAKGKNPDDYAALLSADASTWISSEGDLLFVDVIEHEASEGGGESEPSSPSGPAPTPIRLLANGMPIHHSKPGAPWTIYLDFDGEFVRSQAWRIFNKLTQGLTIDADASTFNLDEQAVISRTWGRVAEDWAPFDVNVTTERPAVISSTVLWSIIGRSPRDLGFAPFVGGVSLFNCGYMNFGPDTPTFTFWEPFGATDHSTIADVITQENGHMFGLLHDGIRLPTGVAVEYYVGHGTGPTSWGPVMGAPASRNVTQWSRGEYPGAQQVDAFGCGIFSQQDDVAIIGAKLGFRADDVGNTIATASSLAVPAIGYLTSTTDVDVYALPRVSDVRIEITPFRAGEQTDGGNLDVAADIVNASGVVVASVDDPNETTATLSALLPPGAHYLRVRSSFNPANYPIYDSLGQYTVTGTFVNVVRFTGFTEPVAPGSTPFEPGRTLPVKFGLTDAVAAARVQLWSELSPLTAQVLAETSCRAQQGFRQHCNLKLPTDLAAGWSYWLVAQYQDLDGHWITAEVAPAISASNPAWMTVR